MRGLASASVEAVRAANAKGLSLIAAGVAFYMLLAIFPGVALVVSVYGLVADPTAIRALLDELARVAPEAAAEILRDIVETTLAAGGAKLSATALISFAIAFWSAGAAVRAVMSALQIAFPDAHAYGAVGYLARSLLFTLAGLAAAIVTLGVMVALPIAFEALRALDPEDRFALGLDLVRRLETVILILITGALLTAIYWFGAGAETARLVSAMAAGGLTTLLWLGASRLLAFYFTHFADLGAVYGPFGAVAGLMLWFWISAFLLLLGAELAAALSERRRPAP